MSWALKIYLLGLLLYPLYLCDFNPKYSITNTKTNATEVRDGSLKKILYFLSSKMRN